MVRSLRVGSPPSAGGSSTADELTASVTHVLLESGSGFVGTGRGANISLMRALNCNSSRWLQALGPFPTRLSRSRTSNPGGSGAHRPAPFTDPGRDYPGGRGAGRLKRSPSWRSRAGDRRTGSSISPRSIRRRRRGGGIACWSDNAAEPRALAFRRVEPRDGRALVGAISSALGDHRHRIAAGPRALINRTASPTRGHLRGSRPPCSALAFDHFGPLPQRARPRGVGAWRMEVPREVSSSRAVSRAGCRSGSFIITAAPAVAAASRFTGVSEQGVFPSRYRPMSAAWRATCTAA